MCVCGGGGGEQNTYVTEPNCHRLIFCFWNKRINKQIAQNSISFRFVSHFYFASKLSCLARARTHARTHAPTHARMHKHARTHVQTRTHAHTCTHTHKMAPLPPPHTHTHTHTHTHHHHHHHRRGVRRRCRLKRPYLCGNRDHVIRAHPGIVLCKLAGHVEVVLLGVGRVPQGERADNWDSIPQGTMEYLPSVFVSFSLGQTQLLCARISNRAYCSCAGERAYAALCLKGNTKRKRQLAEDNKIFIYIFFN